MRRNACIIFLLLAIVLSACSTSSTDSTNESDSRHEDEHEQTTSINPNHFTVYGLKIGDSREDIVKQLGLPDHKDSLDELIKYEYSSLTFYLADSKTIHIESEDSEFSTASSVAIGSNIEEIFNKYEDYEIRRYVGTIDDKNVERAYVIDKKYSLAFDINTESKIERVHLFETDYQKEYINQSNRITSEADWHMLNDRSDSNDELSQSAPGANESSDIEEDPFEVLGTAPDFTLIDMNGEYIDFEDFHGNVRLVHIFYSNDPASSPLTINHLRKVQSLLAEEDLLSQTNIMSITIDPDRDTSDVVQNFVDPFDIDMDHWKFLMPESRTSATELAKDFGLTVLYIGDDQIVYSVFVLLVDQDGSIRKHYNFINHESVESLEQNIVEDIKTLLSKKRSNNWLFD